ncbi:hypothetical protein BGZ76_002338, partial [Entomortierella beljakovae]
MSSDKCDNDNSMRFAALSWLKKLLDLNEEITMPKFALQFGFNQEEYADSTFVEALSSSEIQQPIQNAVLKKYESWRHNEGEKFWASRNSTYRLDVSTEESVGDLINRSRYFTKRLMQTRTEDEPI